MLDELAHPALRDPAPAKDLHRVLRRLLRAPRAIHLQERNLARELLRLLFVLHVAHLVRHVLQPRLHRLRAGDHPRQLRADHRLTDQWLAEHLALGSPPGERN